jgi:hypothetical protein
MVAMDMEVLWAAAVLVVGQADAVVVAVVVEEVVAAVDVVAVDAEVVDVEVAVKTITSISTTLDDCHF